MNEKLCRWGILGTATIARKNWQSIHNSGNSMLVGVASRNVERSTQYIAECQRQVPFDPVPRPFGSYEEMIACDEIDAVYVPLPTSIRKEWVIRAAEAGKHVLCEKPCGVTAADLNEMIEACAKNKVQFMDGVMFMHSRRMDLIREVLNDGSSVGQIKRITSQFSFCADQDWLDSNIRTTSDLEPLGCLGDLGWYNIRFALWTMNYEMPQRVSGRMLTELGQENSPSSVPGEFSGELFFANGVSASFYCSFVTEHQQWVSISGNKGQMRLHDFVLPFFNGEVAFDVSQPVFHFNGCQFNMEHHKKRYAVHEYSNNMANSQETNLFRKFSDVVLTSKLDQHWPNIALQTQSVMDACLASARSDGKMMEIETP